MVSKAGVKPATSAVFLLLPNTFNLCSLLYLHTNCQLKSFGVCVRRFSVEKALLATHCVTMAVAANVAMD